MTNSKTWTINCLLAGAKVAELLSEGKKSEVREYLENLTSDLTQQDIEYIVSRLEVV